MRLPFVFRLCLFAILIPTLSCENAGPKRAGDDTLSSIGLLAISSSAAVLTSPGQTSDSESPPELPPAKSCTDSFRDRTLTPPQSVSADNPTRGYRIGEILVTFHFDVSRGEIERIMEYFGLEYRNAGASYVVFVRPGEERCWYNLFHRLKTVAFASLNFLDSTN